MKIASVLASVLAVVCVATSGLTVAVGHAVTGFEEAGFAPVVGQEVKMTPTLRRHLQTGSGTTDAPTSTPTTTPTPTTATPSTTSPTPTTATPTTTAPAPTTSTPTPTTAAPTTTTETPDATTATPDATTATPDATTATPEATTASPEATTETPSSTTATPTATSTASSTTTDATTSAPSATDNTTSSSGSSSSTSADTSSGSSMSTGAVIGIVVGIVAAVAIIATIIMCVIRRRREGEDDPLSPFELSMDKGYNPTPGGFTAQNSYNPRGVGAGVSASGSMSNRTPQANAVAAGVAYSQFYDNAATSPGSMNRLESNVDSVQTDPGNNVPATNGTNLWLSAMEPKDNDSYLSAQESPRSSRNSSRNSYELSSNQTGDMDQSSQISGHSNKESDDFPDHHEDNDSARGSYEL